MTRECVSHEGRSTFVVSYRRSSHHTHDRFAGCRLLATCARMMRPNKDWILLLVISSSICFSQGVQGWAPIRDRPRISRWPRRLASPEDTSDIKGTDSASKRIVLSLTRLINWWAPRKPNTEDPDRNHRCQQLRPPRSPLELMHCIASDYSLHNYLWTGDIDLSAFDAQCRFTDPTLSFIGTDQYVRNIRNLRPIVEALTKPEGCRSDLLYINLKEDQGFVQSRWNMVGDLEKLPWKPRIDVIGQTRFWYRQQQDNSYQVVSYDEEWEMPAGLALLQLVTPPGMISNASK